MTWIGLAGLTDPIRPGLGRLMAALEAAGIHPLVMTGDQVSTARAVAGQLGLGNGARLRVVDAAEMSSLPSPQLAEAARRAQSSRG